MSSPPEVTAAPDRETREVAQRIREATGRAFAAATAGRRRDPHHVGLSQVGRCPRAFAYALAKTPPTDDPGPEEGRAANLGTWEHDGLLPRLAAELPGARVEVAVVLRAAGLELPGHIDCDTPELPLDLKTVGEFRLQGVRVRQLLGEPAAYPDHRLQVGAYALARLQAGRPPAFVAWLYLDRASGGQQIIVERFTNALALLVLDRVAWLAGFAADPGEAPRGERGPGLSYACDGCPWLKACWGAEATPGRTGPQSARTDPAAEQACADYVTARAAESHAKQAKKDAAVRLEHVRYATYGPFRYWRSRTAVVDDEWAAVARLRELGLEVPAKTKRGALHIKLNEGGEGS